MSGRKCSTVSFDATREQKRQLLNQIDVQRRSAEGIRGQVLQALHDTTRGLRAHFSNESERARLWIEQADAVVSTPQLSLSSSLSDVSQQAHEYTLMMSEGVKVQEHLQESFVKQAGELRAEGAKQIFAVETLLGRGQGLIASWFGSTEVRRAQDSISDLHEHLRLDRLGEVSRLASSLEQDLSAKLSSADENQAKYDQRLYVLKALRQVCAEMGFKELAPPRAERPDDLKSRIILTVDTLNRGEVSFYLSLESIEADSCISKSHCFEEFGQLSAQLAEAFGVMTKFQMTDGKSDPKLRRKGELEEPTGTEHEAETSG
jgi:hypothetical protein